MAISASYAIKAAGRMVGEDIYIVGSDAIPEVVFAIRDGHITGTVFNDHVGQARAAADAAINFIEGKGNDKYILIDYVPVTQGWNYPGR